MKSIFDNSEKDREVVELLKEELPRVIEAKFAIGYFFLSGFRLVEADFPTDEANRPVLKMVMGRETDPATGSELIQGYERREAMKTAILNDLQKISDTGEAAENVSRLAMLIEKGLIEVKLFSTEKLHAKLYLFLKDPTAKNSSKGIALVGSSNFTDSGLTKNKELNLTVTNAADIDYLNEWFDRLWSEADDFKSDLLELIEVSNLNPSKKNQYPKLGTTVSPEKLFRFLVYRWFDGRVGNMLKKDVLAEFQVTGVLNATRMLDRFNGAIIADSVGLGKSFIAGAILEEFIEGKHKNWLPETDHTPSVLLVLPPAVIAQWETLLFDASEGFFFNQYEKKKISNDTKLNDIIYQINIPGEKKKSTVRLLSTGLLQNYSEDDPRTEKLADQFDMILLDEAHKFRNASTKRWKVMRQLQKKKNGFQNRVLLLTATPVNNSIYDLYNLIRLFNDDSFAPFAELGVKPADLFPRYATLRHQLESKDDAEKAKELKETVRVIQTKILDEILLLRTRKYIARNFKDVTINGAPLAFKDPRPDPVDITPFYSAEYRSFINKLHERIEKIDFNHTRLYGAQYLIFNNHAGGDDSSQEAYLISLADIFRLLLAKRLESGIFAFEVTLQRIASKERNLLGLLKEKKQHIHDLESFESILKESLEESGAKTQFDDTVSETGELESDEELTWIERTVKILEAEITRYLSENKGLPEPASESERLQLGLSLIMDSMTKDLEQFDMLITELDQLKEKDTTGKPRTLGKLNAIDTDTEERPVYVYSNDPKLEALKQILGRRESKSPSLEKVASLYEAKTILFTGYKDTAQYLQHHIENWVKTNESAGRWLLDKKGRLKLGLVTGDTGADTRDNFKKRFAPVANNGHRVKEHLGEIDLLVSTDAFSEGVNLQDGNAVVNYDLPWNPMVIVQRVGRVNRIGNDKDVNVINFHPGAELEPMLGLIAKLQRKIKDVSLLVGSESRILRYDEKVDVKTIGERIKKIAELNMTELEEMSLHPDLSDGESGRDNLEADEFQLLNYIQYDLSYTESSFDDVKNLKEPLNCVLSDQSELYSVYELSRGRMKEKSIYKVDKDGNIHEGESPLVFKNLVSAKAGKKRPSLIQTAKHLAEIQNQIQDRQKNVHEEAATTQEGFLRSLIFQLDDEFEDVAEDDPVSKDYISARNSLTQLRAREYSGPLRSALREADLLEELPGNKIKIRDGHRALKVIRQIFEQDKLDSIDFSQNSVHYGWFTGGAE